MPRCDVVEWKQALRAQRELTGHQVAAALALTLWMRRDGFIGDPPVSLGTVAAVLARDRTRVSHAVTELVDLGWLERQERPGRTSYLWAATPASVQASWPQLGEPVAPDSRVPVASDSRVDGEPVASHSRVPVAPDSRVDYLAKQPVAPDGRDLWRHAVPKSIPGSNTTTPNVLGTAERLRATNGGQDMRMATPESEPALWAQAQQELDALPAGTVKNPPAYRLAIFRRLVDQQHEAQQRNATHNAITNCTRCGPSGYVITTEDGHEVARRCPHD